MRGLFDFATAIFALAAAITWMMSANASMTPIETYEDQTPPFDPYRWPSKGRRG